MTVMYTLPDLHFGGASNLLLRNIKSLQERHSINVHIMFFGSDRTMYTNFAELDVRLIHVRYNRYIDIFSAISAIRKYITENKVDVIQTNLSLDKALIGLASIFMNVKKITTIHSATVRRYKKSFKSKLLLYLESFFSNYIYDNTIVVSEAGMESAISERRIKQNKLRLIYNGIAPLPRIDSKLESEDIVFVTACRLSFIKGLNRLIKVFAKVSNQFPNCKLVILGDGPLLPTLKQLCVDLEVQNKVSFIGFVNDVTPHLNSAHYYVNSSLSEAMPISVLEAMSLGKPIIGSKVGGLIEIIDHDKDGYLVDFNDEIQAVNTICHVIKNHSQDYTLLSKHSEEKYFQKFSSETYVNQLFDLYKEVN